MSVMLRSVLLLAAVLTALWILKKVRKMKVKMYDAVFWVCMAILLAILGFFPKLSYQMANFLGIQSPANFVFLIILFIFMEKLFTLSIKVSQLEDKIEELTITMSINTKEFEEGQGQDEKTS